MVRFVIARVAYAVVALAVVATIVFFLARLSGDPAALMLPSNATPDQIEALRARLGLDRPLWEQYVRFMTGVLTRADFGHSFRLGQGAMSLVLERAGATAQLTLAALAVAVIIGVPAAIVSALRPGQWVDATTQMVAVVGQSVPTFWLGLVLIVVFGVQLRWFPVMGSGTPMHLILPALTLGAPTAALIARMMRSSILEVVSEDYVRTARAKGLPEHVVFGKHVLGNALIPVITVVLLQMGTLMGGAVVTETVFNYPGMGLLAIQAIQGRDYAVVQAFVVGAASIVIALNFVADVMYAVIDPRVRYEWM